jgi:hypothetical protein
VEKIIPGEGVFYLHRLIVTRGVGNEGLYFASRLAIGSERRTGSEQQGQQN